MNGKRLIALTIALSCAGGLTAGCALTEEAKPEAKRTDSETDKPYSLSFVVKQVGDIPDKDNAIEKAMEAYTGTKLSFQWVPSAAYDDKINVMIATNELPKLLKVNYTPITVSSMQSGIFWELGRYLKDYKNLSVQNAKFYDNIRVDGKLYGIPLYRELGRAVIHYRKDWFSKLELAVPQTTGDWYKAMQAISLKDPDNNGKHDTYGMIVDRKYNEGPDSLLTRLAVSIGAPNKWKEENGSFTPEFMSPEFYEVMKLFRQLYAEKLINRDFAVLDSTEADKLYDLGRAGIRISGGSAQTYSDRLVKNVPEAVVGAAPLAGPKGRRVPGESGNSGLLVIPKSSVKSEAELKRVMKFVDQLMDPPMAQLLVKGIEGKHFVDKGTFTESLSRDANQREIKPYRDNLPYISDYNVKPGKLTPLAVLGQQIWKENEAFAVSNPVLTLSSQTYSERGKELDQQIADAQTKFIMSKIDEAGWQDEVEKWKKNGGTRMMDEYAAAYASLKK